MVLRFFFRRRNRPALDPDRRIAGFFHAANIDKNRLKLRRMWRAVMLLDMDPNNPTAHGANLISADTRGISHHREKNDVLVFSRPREESDLVPKRDRYGSEDTGHVAATKKRPNNDLLHAEIEESLVKKSLMWLEPLDKAICRLGKISSHKTDSLTHMISLYALYRPGM